MGKFIFGVVIKILSDDKEECEVGGVGVIYVYFFMFVLFKYINIMGM